MLYQNVKLLLSTKNVFKSDFLSQRKRVGSYTLNAASAYLFSISVFTLGVKFVQLEATVCSYSFFNFVQSVLIPVRRREAKIVPFNVAF